MPDRRAIHFMPDSPPGAGDPAPTPAPIPPPAAPAAPAPSQVATPAPGNVVDSDAVIQMPDGGFVRVADVPGLAAKAANSLTPEQMDEFKTLQAIAAGDMSAIAKAFGKQGKFVPDPAEPQLGTQVSPETAALRAELDAMKKEFGTTQRKMQELDNLAALRTQAEAKHMITTYGQHLPALAIMAKNNGESTAGRLGQMLREARSAAEQKFNVPFDRLPAQQQVEVNVAVLQLAEQGAREMAQALGVTLPTPKPAQQTQVQDDQGIRREGSTMFHVVDGQIQDNRGNVYVPDAAGRLIPTRIPGVAAPGSTMSPDSGRPRNAPMSRQDLRQGIRATLEARNVNNIQ